MMPYRKLCNDILHRLAEKRHGVIEARKMETPVLSPHTAWTQGITMLLCMDHVSLM